MADFCIEFALKNGASYSEARLELNSAENFLLTNGVPTLSEFSKDYGLGIRVLVNGAMSFLAVNDFDKNKLKIKIKQAIRFARATWKIKKELIQFSPSNPIKDRWEVKAKKKIEDVDPKEKMSLLFDIEKEFKQMKKAIPSRFFQLSTTVSDKYYVNSEGSQISSKIPRVMIYYSLVAQKGNQSEQRYFQFGESNGWEVVKKWKLPEKIGDEGKVLLDVISKAKPIPSGNVDLVLSPELVGIAMHESCGHPYEADRIMGREGAQAGESFITRDWLGQRIGSDVVTVVDDPTIENNYGFYLQDDEGVEARRRFLIKDGIVNEFLLNREFAKKMGTNSNAAARASGYDREPIVRMSNTFMLPGEYSFDELVEGIRSGIYIKSFTEWNIDDKRWNERYVGCEAYLIENGELKGLVRRPILEMTTKSFFMAVDACGKDLDFIPGSCGKGDPMQGIPVWMGGPHIRLRNILIGGR